MPVESYHGFVDSLLRDPSEIWHHAYEQEISEAGRSVLLAIRTLGGKCDVRVLEGVFGPLHMHRAARYNFSRRPEDFRVGIREVMNSFIKPCGQDGFEVIDTSVLDLLNAVARGAPDNAVDMIEGAARFDQIEQIWSLAKAERGGNILAALKRESHRIAPSIARLARLRRRFDIEGGGVGYFSPTFEVRLALIVEMAQRLGAPLIAALIAPAYVLLLEEWGAERPQINDAIKLLRTMDAAVSLPADSITPMRNTVLDAVKGHKDKLRIFQSVVFITIDGVDFVPFVSLLLTEVNGTRIADRVVVMTDGDKGTRAEDDEEDTANDGEAETRNTLPDETEQSGDGTRAAPEEEVVDGGLIPGERRKFALDRLAGELGATDYFAAVISTYSLESELIEAGNAELLEKAYLELHPRSKSKWRNALKKEGDERAKAINKIFKNARKGDFAQILARRVEDGEELKVPAYIAHAIEQLVVT
ncbi:hypothetical protein D516_3969 [Rhodobacter sp. AKP1]|nr:hypothetical protein D516_3969 [Rhodobacter sp. AKP1]